MKFTFAVPYSSVLPPLLSQSGPSDPLTITEPTPPSKRSMEITPSSKLTEDHHTNLLCKLMSLIPRVIAPMMKNQTSNSPVTTSNQDSQEPLVPPLMLELCQRDSPLMMMISS